MLVCQRQEGDGGEGRGGVGKVHAARTLQLQLTSLPIPAVGPGLVWVVVEETPVRISRVHFIRAHRSDCLTPYETYQKGSGMLLEATRNCIIEHDLMGCFGTCADSAKSQRRCHS